MQQLRRAHVLPQFEGWPPRNGLAGNSGLRALRRLQSPKAGENTFPSYLMQLLAGTLNSSLGGPLPRVV